MNLELHPIPASEVDLLVQKLKVVRKFEVMQRTESASRILL
jgi:hypothetical protein